MAGVLCQAPSLALWGWQAGVRMAGVKKAEARMAEARMAKMKMAEARMAGAKTAEERMAGGSTASGPRSCVPGCVPRRAPLSGSPERCAALAAGAVPQGSLVAYLLPDCPAGPRGCPAAEGVPQAEGRGMRS